jgi:hypothetical protein
MDRRDVHAGVTRSWNVVESLGIGETFASPRPLDVNERFRDLALSDETTYPELYLLGLSVSHFNFALADYSYFQFSWLGGERVRYAYYPNPFSGGGDKALQDLRDLQELVSSGDLSYEEYLALIRDTSLDVRVPLIRYEHSPDDYVEFQHPSSHFHIGHHSENRWALNRVLTPLAFTLIIVKQYYASHWLNYGKDDDNEFLNRYEAQLVSEKPNCPFVVTFSWKEGRTFFFS